MEAEATNEPVSETVAQEPKSFEEFEGSGFTEQFDDEPMDFTPVGEDPKVNKDSKKKDETPEQKVSEPQIDEDESLDPLEVAKEKTEEEEVPKEPEPIKFKAKVNGKEIDAEVHPDDIPLLYQKAVASDEKFREASEMRKQAVTFLDNFKTPDGVVRTLEAVGYNVAELAENYLYQQIQLQQMDPKDRRIMELEQQRKLDAEAQQTAQKERLEQAKAEQSKIIKADLETEIIEALKSSNLPQEGPSVKRIAAQMKIHAQRGVEITPKQAARLAEKQLASELRTLAAKMGPEKIGELLGDEGIKVARQASLNRMKKNGVKPRQSAPMPPEPPLPKRGFRTEEEIKQMLSNIK